MPSCLAASSHAGILLLRAAKSPARFHDVWREAGNLPAEPIDARLSKDLQNSFFFNIFLMPF